MMKVFLVDDEIAIRENLRNSFPWEEKGYQLVGEAPDGEMALPMLRDLNADILLTDIRMPFMDGIRPGIPAETGNVIGTGRCAEPCEPPD